MPALATPALITMLPAPALVARPAPDCTSTVPPETLPVIESVVSPADITKLPPLDEFDEPITTDSEPAVPEPALPTPITTAPVLPHTAVPVDSRMLPDAPAVPALAFSVRIVMLPLELDVVPPRPLVTKIAPPDTPPAPDNRDTEPPTPFAAAVAAPALTSTTPPVVVVVAPALIDRLGAEFAPLLPISRLKLPPAVLPAPVDNAMYPPVPVLSLEEPAEIQTAPPDAEFDVPATNDNEPEAAPIAAPLAIVTAPDAPEKDVPELITSKPELPDDSALAVRIHTKPLLVAVPWPDARNSVPPAPLPPEPARSSKLPPDVPPSPPIMLKSPPNAVADDDEPAANASEPALPTSPDPSRILTPPARPPRAALVPIRTSPLLPQDVVPVLSTRLPDTPSGNAFADRSTKFPDEVAVPSPLVM